MNVFLGTQIIIQQECTGIVSSWNQNNNREYSYLIKENPKEVLKKLYKKFPIYKYKTFLIENQGVGNKKNNYNDFKLSIIEKEILDPKKYLLEVNTQQMPKALLEFYNNNCLTTNIEEIEKEYNLFINKKSYSKNKNKDKLRKSLTDYFLFVSESLGEEKIVNDRLEYFSTVFQKKFKTLDEARFYLNNYSIFHKKHLD